MPTETFDPNGLFAGDYPRMTRTGTIASGQNLTRGAVLGRITASGKLIRSVAAAADGSQTPVGILTFDVDASGGDKPGHYFVSGEFDGSKLNYGAGHTAATVEAAFVAAFAPIAVRTTL